MNLVLFSLLLIFETISCLGQSWQWAKNEKAYGTILGECNDAAGNVYIVGTSTTNAIIGTFSASVQNFGGIITKYNQFGTALWVKNYDGITSCDVNCDNTGNVFLTGSFVGTLVAGTTTLNSPSGSDIFLIKHDAAGNVLWVRSGTGFGQKYANTLCTDASGNCFIAGAFTSTIVSFGALTLSNTSTSFKYYVVKYDANGTELWARTSQSGLAISNDVAVDANGDVVMIGNTMSPTLVVGSYTFLSQSYNFFVTKYTASGSLLWAFSGGGSNQDFGNSVSIDPSGDIYICGGSSSSVCTIGTYTFSTLGDLDLYLAKYNSQGVFQWARNGGGVSREEAWSIAADAAGVYAVGRASSPTISISSTTMLGVAGTYSTDGMFLFECSPTGNVVNSIILDGGGDSGNISLWGNCNMYLGGSLLTPTVAIGIDTLTNNTPSTTVFFIAKYNRNASTPIISINGNLLLCQGQNSTLTATGAQSYTWMGGPNSNSIVVIPNITTTYTVFGTNQTNNCSNISKVKVVVAPIPSINISTSKTEMCNGESIKLSGSGAITYSWSNGIQQTTISVSPSVTTNYSVTGYNSFGCSATSSITVISKPCLGIDESPFELNF